MPSFCVMTFWRLESLIFIKMDQLTNLLVEGMKARNAGDYLKAYDLFEEAKNINWRDYRIYEHLYKIDFFLEKYEDAFKNLLILIHKEILAETVHTNPMGHLIFEQEAPYFYSENTHLFDYNHFNPSLIRIAVKNDHRLLNLIVIGNTLIYRAGHAYMGSFLNTNMLKQYPNRDELFENYNYRITDRNKGDSFFTIGLKNYFVCIGFIYAHMNLNLLLEDMDEVINYYSKPNLIIKKNIWDYNNYII